MEGNSTETNPPEDRWLHGYWGVAGFVPWIYLAVLIGRQKGYAWSDLDNLFVGSWGLLVLARVVDARNTRTRWLPVVLYLLGVSVAAAVVWGLAQWVAMQRG